MAALAEGARSAREGRRPSSEKWSWKPAKQHPNSHRVHAREMCRVLQLRVPTKLPGSGDYFAAVQAGPVGLGQNSWSGIHTNAE
jgi:hypothetical protein